MRISQIRKMDISNGNGVGVSMFTAGCHFHCKGCHNYELWDPNKGLVFTDKETRDILAALQHEYISRFSILGGEPLEDYNLKELAKLIAQIRETQTVAIWLYTGWTFEELMIKMKGNKILSFILQNIDVLVDGPFIQEQKDITLEFRGSKNQRVLDMRQSLLHQKPIEIF